MTTATRPVVSSITEERAGRQSFARHGALLMTRPLGRLAWPAALGVPEGR